MEIDNLWSCSRIKTTLKNDIKQSLRVCVVVWVKQNRHFWGFPTACFGAFTIGLRLFVAQFRTTASNRALAILIAKANPAKSGRPFDDHPEVTELVGERTEVCHSQACGTGHGNGAECYRVGILMGKALAEERRLARSKTTLRKIADSKFRITIKSKALTAQEAPLWLRR